MLPDGISVHYHERGRFEANRFDAAAIAPRNLPARIEAGKLLVDLPPHSVATVVVEFG